MTDSYTMTVTIRSTPEEAEERLRTALSAEGFGILSEIDGRSTLQEKLGEDIGPYKILGACNPALANRAIAADPDVGALLPCNVLIRRNAEGGVHVAAIDPRAMLAIGVADLAAIAEDARARLQRALESLEEE